MKTWRLAAVGAVVLALSGCRTDPEITRLERENFYKQREIEKLRWQIEDIEDGVAPLRGPCEVPSTRPDEAESSPLGESGPRLGPAAGGTPSTSFPPASARPVPSTREEKSAPPPPPEEETTPKSPVIELPRDLQSPGQAPLGPRSSEPSGAKPPDGGAWAAPADSARAAQITIGQCATYPASSSVGTHPGGLAVIVEPRDITGRVLAAPGDVSAVLVDRAAAEGAAPVARWDFRAAQTAGMLVRGPHGGINLNLPWADGPPAQNGLRLFVRYTTRDGRKLQVERPLDLAAAGQRPSGWLPTPQGPTTEPIAPKDAWRPSDSGGAAPSEAEPDRTASHPSDPTPRRPVWSPERPN
jgi:hypothetical protein